MNEEQKVKLLAALLEVWEMKVLDLISQYPYPDFDTALEHVKRREMGQFE